MKKIILFLAMSLLLCACEPSAVTNGRRLYRDYFDYILKDPQSLEIHKETHEGEFIVNWVVDYSAKNSLGGRQRKTVKFQTIENTIYVEHSDGTKEFYKAEELR